MTPREEQIEQAAKDIARKWYHDPNNETAYIAARQGMLWSDEHPKPNLVDIDKAVEWLKGHAHRYKEHADTPYNDLDLVRDFKQAMMEE